MADNKEIAGYLQDALDIMTDKMPQAARQLTLLLELTHRLRDHASAPAGDEDAKLRTLRANLSELLGRFEAEPGARDAVVAYVRLHIEAIDLALD